VQVTVEARQVCKDRRRCDVGAVFPAAKAAIDGLVDAEVIPDDTDIYLVELAFRPALVLGYNALRLTIEGAPCGREERERRECELREKLLRQFV
jgi:hypothetical protein